MSFYSFENRPVHPGVTPWKSAGGRSVVGQVSVAWLWGHTRAVILKKVEIACFRMVPLLQPVPLAMWCHWCGGPGVWRWLHEGWWAQGASGMGGVEGLGECFEVPPPISISSEFPQKVTCGCWEWQRAGGGIPPPFQGLTKAVFQEMTKTKSECGSLLWNTDLWLNSWPILKCSHLSCAYNVGLNFLVPLSY